MNEALPKIVKVVLLRMYADNESHIAAVSDFLRDCTILAANVLTENLKQLIPIIEVTNIVHMYSS